MEPEKVYAPKPPQHPVEYDIEQVTEEKKAEVKALILKNHLPPTPFGINFPGGLLLRITDIEVVEGDFRVFVDVEKDGQKLQDTSPWVYKAKIKAPNGTWDKETDTENEEVNYRRAFELLLIETLKNRKLI